MDHDATACLLTSFDCPDKSLITQKPLIPSLLIWRICRCAYPPKRSIYLDERPQRVAGLGAVADERNRIGAYSRIRCEITVAKYIGRAGHRDHVNKPLLAHSPDLLLAHLGSLEPAESDQASEQILRHA